MKKLFVLFLAAIMLLSVAACSDNKPETDDVLPEKTDSAHEDPQETEQSGYVPETESPTPVPTPEPTPEPKPVWDGAVAESYGGGSGSSYDPYLISNAAQLARLAYEVNNGWEYYVASFSPKGYFKLTDDIYLNDVSDWDAWSESNAPANEWVPIGNLEHKFCGFFDGGGHTIYGLYINEPETDCVGLFGHLSGGTTNDFHTGRISDLRVEKAFVKGQNTVGGLSGLTNKFEFVNVAFSGKVYGNKYVGGMVGGFYNDYTYHSAQECVFTDCSVSVKVSGEVAVGGIGGSVSAKFSGCHASGEVTGTENTGGICGSAGGEYVDSYNEAAVSGGEYTGGITGYGGYIVRCYNNGSISGNKYVGGISGYYLNYDMWVKEVIVSCYNTGTVTGGDFVSGIIPEYISAGKVKTCFNIGNISGSSNVFAISATTSENCFYLVGSCGGDNYASALTAEEMKNAGSFTGFDFDSVWMIDVGAGHPVLIVPDDYDD